MPAIEAQVREELARAQPEIDRAIAQARAANMDVRVQQSIDKATKVMKMRIEIQKAHDAHMDEHDDVPPAPDEN
jgi:aminoglycoside phosphotransferase family enzyme